MDCLRITGGIPLHGTVWASGSKNAALPIMAASLLTDGAIELARVPRLTDVDTMALLLNHLGVEVRRDEAGTVHLENVDHAPTRAPYRLVRRMRASFCVLGPLVARRRRAAVALPGGCAIGTRPVDLHLAGLAALGANVRIVRGYVVAEARGLRGARIDLAGPYGSTVTGTANVMSAATLARGTTVITSAATEPEIVDLGRLLLSMGARITGLGTRTVEITGVAELAGARHQVIPDRIEAATLLLAAAITRGRVTVGGVEGAHLSAVLDALVAAGAEVHCGRHEVTVAAHNRAHALAITARAYPAMPTDLQAQWMAVLSLAGGTSLVRDAVFPERFSHVAELQRLGARIVRRGPLAMIDGVRRLDGAIVSASDLRASAALILAGLAAQGQTTVRRVHHLDRGYERLDEKLSRLGAQILRTRSARAGADAAALVSA